MKYHQKSFFPKLIKTAKIEISRQSGRTRITKDYPPLIPNVVLYEGWEGGGKERMYSLFNYPEFALPMSVHFKKKKKGGGRSFSKHIGMFASSTQNLGDKQ